MEKILQKPLKKILITGFEPFAENKVNPSAELMLYLSAKGYETRILPVSYSLLSQELETLDIQQYDFIFMFGLAAERAAISFERVALNWIESSVLDNTGHAPLPQPIQAGISDAIINKLPLEKWLSECEDLGLNIKMSHTAGTYLCNYLYFKVLLKNKNALFIHIPKENDFDKLNQMVELLISQL